MSDSEKSEKSEKSKMVSIGGLWKNKGKDGKLFFSGRLGGARLLIFQNNFKKDGSKEPDLVMYVAPHNPKDKKATKNDEDLDKMFGEKE